MQKYAPEVNDFYFHRPCGFATTTTDSKGKQKKIYKTYLTPFEKIGMSPVV